MDAAAWLTLAVLGLCFGLLAFTRIAPDIVLAGGLTLLLVSGVLSPEQALSGLANQGMVTVGVLYIVVAGLRETGAVDWIVHRVLGRPRTLYGAQLRLMLPVAVMSAFLNNTPVVAMMIPAVQDWAKRHRLSVSKLMIPLSYAAIAGGMCTLIGTSTNLIINGQLMTYTGSDGLDMFEIGQAGIAVAVAVIGAVLVLSRWLLPERVPALSQFSNVREYTVEMLVEEQSPLLGRSIEEAGLRQLPGLYLIEIDRSGQVIPAVSPTERLQANDRLIFAGIVDSVVDLQKIRGLKPATDQVFKLNAPRPERCLIEAVISDSCPLISKSIRVGRFRTLYNAAVIAVSRNGEQVHKKIGDIVLRPGDTLLLEAHPSFVSAQRNSRDFFLVSRLEDSSPPRHERVSIALIILAAMVLSVAFGWLSMLEAVLLAAGLMIITRCVSGSAARRSVDWQVLIVIAASLGIGQALLTTGAARAVAEKLLSVSGSDPTMALATVFLLTAAFTAMITNNAAAVLMFPIALALSDTLNVSFVPFVIALMLAASASFATPIGYQTNLMVYGPGGYRFKDYFFIGLPLTLLAGLVTIVLVPMIWPF